MAFAGPATAETQIDGLRQLGALLVSAANDARVGDILSIGDDSLLWASALAWLGIGIATVTSALAVYRPEPPPYEDGHLMPRRG
jgi:hypothetical protein